MPHRLQDDYDRTRKEREFTAVVLENEFLRATFLTEIGGRLWSLFHKPSNRELLYVNPVFQPGNLAIRNAWFSGGVEWLHLGVMYYNEKDIDAAKRAWEKSLALEPSPWAYRNMAVLAKHDGQLAEAADLLLTACQMAPQIPSLAQECCQALLEAGRPRDMLNFLDNLPRQIRDRGRMQVMEARAALKMGHLQKVEEILQNRPSVPDIREGEVTLSDLWFEMHEKRIAAAENVPIDDKLRQRVRKDYPPPSWLDFRQVT